MNSTAKDRLITSGDLARKFQVSPKTTSRWMKDGRLGPVVLTAGGHRRIYESVAIKFAHEHGLAWDGAA